MLKKDIQVGEKYTAKVSNQLTTVRIVGESRRGGWEAINTKTNRTVHIRSAAKLRNHVPSNGNGNGNGNADRQYGSHETPITKPQMGYIDRLFNERDVTGNTVMAYNQAVESGTVTSRQADTFIKKLLTLPLTVDGSEEVKEAKSEVKHDVSNADLDLNDAIESAVTFLADHMSHVKGKKADQLDGVILRLTDFLDTGN